MSAQMDSIDGLRLQRRSGTTATDRRCSMEEPTAHGAPNVVQFRLNLAKALFTVTLVGDKGEAGHRLCCLARSPQAIAVIAHT